PSLLVTGVAFIPVVDVVRSETLSGPFRVEQMVETGLPLLRLRVGSVLLPRPAIPLLSQRVVVGLHADFAARPAAIRRASVPVELLERLLRTAFLADLHGDLFKRPATTLASAIFWFQNSRLVGSV